VSGDVPHARAKTRKRRKRGNKRDAGFREAVISISFVSQRNPAALGFKKILRPSLRRRQIQMSLLDLF
jgi:hypothetical protein